MVEQDNIFYLKTVTDKHRTANESTMTNLCIRADDARRNEICSRENLSCLMVPTRLLRVAFTRANRGPCRVSK